MARDRGARSLPSRSRPVRESVDRAVGLQHQFHATISPTWRSTRGFEMATALGAPVITSSSNIKTVPRGRRCRRAAQDAQSACITTRGSIPTSSRRAKSLTDALQARPVHCCEPRHRPLHRRERGRRRVPAAASRPHRDPAPQGPTRHQGPNVPFGEGDAPITQVLQLAAAERLADSRQHRIRIQGRRHRGRGSALPRLLPRALA